jgi:hypothetical protein
MQPVMASSRTLHFSPLRQSLDEKHRELDQDGIAFAGRNQLLRECSRTRDFNF